ncbi:uncharacterized protein [Arachis hypogaea]|uniref:uncharacterized protein n=1 Tax=Arachis hypogaea TaxID=3818 RepID=UPI003B21D6B9
MAAEGIKGLAYQPASSPLGGAGWNSETASLGGTGRTSPLKDGHLAGRGGASPLATLASSIFIHLHRSASSSRTQPSSFIHLYRSASSSQTQPASSSRTIFITALHRTQPSSSSSPSSSPSSFITVVFLELAVAVTVSGRCLPRRCFEKVQKTLTSITPPSISLSPPFALKIATRFVVSQHAIPLAVLLVVPLVVLVVVLLASLSLAVLLASLSRFCSPCCSKVDINNLEEYISLVVDATIKTGITHQMEAFKAGFN